MPRLRSLNFFATGSSNMPHLAVLDPRRRCGTSRCWKTGRAISILSRSPVLEFTR